MVLYIITDGDYCKLGITTNMIQRFEHYKTHNPTVELNSIWKGNELSKIETIYHTNNKPVHKKEWYYLKDINDMKNYLLQNNCKLINNFEVLDKNLIHFKYELMKIFNDLSHGAIKVYAYILKSYNFDTRFEIGKATRGTISEYCKISESNVAASLAELKTKELLFSPQRSLYMINPRYAFKGSTSNRDKSLKAIIELGCENC